MPRDDTAADAQGCFQPACFGTTIPTRSGGADGETRRIALTLRIDAAIEVACFRHGCTLPAVLRQLPGVG